MLLQEYRKETLVNMRILVIGGHFDKVAMDQFDATVVQQPCFNQIVIVVHSPKPESVVSGQ